MRNFLRCIRGGVGLYLSGVGQNVESESINEILILIIEIEIIYFYFVVSLVISI